MKTAEALKNQEKCQQQGKKRKIDWETHKTIGKVLLKSIPKRDKYIHDQFMEEAEGEAPTLAPPILLSPLF